MPRPRPLERPPPLPTFGPPPPVLLCSICLTQASNLGHLKRHIAHNHPGPRQPCGSCMDGPRAQMSWRLKAAEEEARLFQAELPPVLAPPHPTVRVRHNWNILLVVLAQVFTRRESTVVCMLCSIWRVLRFTALLPCHGVQIGHKFSIEMCITKYILIQDCMYNAK